MLPVVQVPGDDALAAAFLVHDQIDGEILDEELRLVLQALLVEGVQQRVTGAVRGGAGAQRR